MGAELYAEIARQKMDLLVVGAGPAGLAAAAKAASMGAKVLILDEAPQAGGRLPGQKHQTPAGYSDGAAKAAELISKARSSGAVIQAGVTAWGLSRDGGQGWFVGACPVDHTGQSYPAGIEARSVILALGAVQRPLVMPGWTMPGVITAGAAQTMVNVHGILPGKRVLCVGIDPLCIAAAEALAGAGAEVLGPALPPDNGLQFGPTTPQNALKELGRLAGWSPSALLGFLARAGAMMPGLASMVYPCGGYKVGGIRLQLKRAALELSGNGRVNRARMTDLDGKGTARSGETSEYEVDAVVTSGGLRPLTDLAQVGGCPLVHIPGLGGWTVLHGPELQTPLAGIFAAGSSTGVEGAAVAQAQGALAGLSAARYLGLMDDQAWQTASVKAQQEIESARETALPFTADIRSARQRMAERWSSQS